MQQIRWVGQCQSSQPAAPAYSQDIRRARRLAPITHEAFQSSSGSLFGRSKNLFYDMKGGPEPTNGRTLTTLPQGLQALALALAKRLNGQLKLIVYN